MKSCLFIIMTQLDMKSQCCIHVPHTGQQTVAELNRSDPGWAPCVNLNKSYSSVFQLMCSKTVSFSPALYFDISVTVRLLNRKIWSLVSCHIFAIVLCILYPQPSPAQSLPFPSCGALTWRSPSADYPAGLIKGRQPGCWLSDISNT